MLMYINVCIHVLIKYYNYFVSKYRKYMTELEPMTL